MLKIGISYYPEDDLFLSGKNQTALVLAEVFSNYFQYDVTLVNVKNSEKTWWVEYPQPPNMKTARSMDGSTFDYFIDIDALVHPDSRTRLAPRSIVFLRTFVQFSEMDKTVYYEMPYVPRYFDGLYEIWCWDILNPKESLESVQTIFSCPLRTVPFVWSASITNCFQRPLHRTVEGTTWKVHVAEKNVDNTSSCIIPLVAIRELTKKNIISATYYVHNTEHLKDNKFLKENVLDNIESTKLPIEFVKKEPYYEWNQLGSILFSHSRFIPIRLSLIQALWLGIPVVHNSPILRDLHPVLASLYYVGNQISDISQTFLNLSCNATLFYESIGEIREAIMDQWRMDRKYDAWKTAMDRLTDELKEKPVSMVVSEPILQKDVVIVAFSDMWPGFNYDQNFIIDSLCHEVKNHYSGGVKEIKGMKYSKDVTPDVVIVGPYSMDWKGIPTSIPKVYFSGENWNLPDESDIALFITSSRKKHSKFVRIPTWMTFIDWFTNSTSLPTHLEDNPIRLPLHFATTSHPVPFESRSDFCAFVVSNPICQFRNQTFEAIHQYKHVNSGGHLYNNIGEQLELKYPGGGCGDISKHHFFAKHRFTISFENSQADGYITEKVLHAKMAGCVPLYWGDTNTSDFVEGSIINLSHISDPAKVLAILQKLEETPALCSTIASTPILNEEKKQQALSMISTMSRRILSLVRNEQPSATSVEYKKSTHPLTRIDKTFVINLDCRPDRWKSLLENEPYLESIATRISAVDGKTLKMNRFLFDLFQHNDFKWKKSVMGCSLSHIRIWSQILKEECNSFLVLEDDVRFESNWLESWQQYAKHIPEDAELLYLGGVLPPNRPILPQVLERVNDYWSKIQPNVLFSPIPLPVFHFCTYSYIITKKGAEKLLDFIMTSEKRSFTSIDHLLGHYLIGLNKYIATPLLTHCFQEDDPVYRESNFNDMQRKDRFDSDIWNNTECFTEQEIKEYAHPVVSSAPLTVETSSSSLPIYYLKTNDEPYELYEQKWLEEVFSVSFTLHPLHDLTQLVPDGSWFIVNRPNVASFHSYFQMLQQHNLHFKVIHLSDEFEKDPLDFYYLTNCKAVVRNYLRNDVPSLPHIVTIPLGYHHRPSLEVQNKPFEQRKLVWSFHGTNWFGREQVLMPLQDMTPNNCLFVPDWNHPSMIKERDYLSFLSNTKFIPILRGNHPETFRLYECLESGCIPICVEDDSISLFYDSIRTHLPIPVCKKEDLKSMITNLLHGSQQEEYRMQLLASWRNYKEQIRLTIQHLL
jgi:GR25 family glycosyltransferase involved in LPS biosynthesis